MLQIYTSPSHANPMTLLTCACFDSLCRPASKNYQGTPFQLIQAQGVDLFPQTPHMEVVLLLLRGRALTNHLAASKDA
jgi:hypothetical protein